MQGVIFMGLQASGKSSFYLQQFYDTHIRLNLDMLKTRHREQLLFTACLTAKQPLVIDNTNPTLEDRQHYIPALQQQQFAVIGYYFSANLQQSLVRNQQRSGKACVPEAAIRATFAKLQRPSYQEGFTQLYYVQLNQGQFTVSDWCSDEV